MKSNFRLVSATCENLEEMVKEVAMAEEVEVLKDEAIADHLEEMALIEVAKVEVTDQ